MANIDLKSCRQRPALVALPLILAGVLLGTGCAEETVQTTTRNLYRPGPLALVCTGRLGDAGVTTGLPPSHCPSSDAAVSDATVRGTLFGFVASTSRGEVAVFRAGNSTAPLVDLNRSSPGFGFIPVGSRPSDLVASKDGCRVVTANNGSCDLALLDVPGVMKISAGELKLPSGGVVSRVVPRTSSGQLNSRPQELVLVPSSVPTQGSGSCPTDTGSYRAYVSFPRCNMVAELDLSTGRVLQAVQFAADGSASVVAEPSCPLECNPRGDTTPGDGRGDGPAPRDAGPPDADGSADRGATDGPAESGLKDGSGGGGFSAAETGSGALDASAADSATAADSAGDGPADSGVSAFGVLPWGLAVTENGDRLYVSSAGAGFISAIDINTQTGKFGSIRKISLAGSPGTTRIKLSPTTRSYGRYLYAIGNDRSVRVLSVETSPEVECETNLDLARFPDGGVPLAQARCVPVDTSDGGPARLVTATEYGIRFGTKTPMDLEFVLAPESSFEASVDDSRPHATPLQGVYMMVAVSDGSVYVIDIEDWTLIKPGTTSVPPTRMPHRFRNAYLGLVNAIPDASVNSISGTKTGGVPVVVSSRKPGELNSDASLPGQGVYLRAPGEDVTTDWQLVYEARVVARWSGSLRAGQEGLVLEDRGADLCRAGVQARVLDSGKRQLRHGDIAVLVGCNDNSECGLDQVCIRSVVRPTNLGLCVEKDRKDEMATRCKLYLDNAREYVVHEARTTQMLLDVLPAGQQKLIRQTPPKNDCASNADCAERFLCALEDQPETGLKRGECFRPGCETDNDCLTKLCRQPLDGSPKVCVPAPLPIETGPACTTEAACRSRYYGQTGPACNADADCNDLLAECRKASTGAAQKTCVDRGMSCSTLAGPALAGLGGTCARISPCFTQLLRYDVRAGRAFVTGGEQRGTSQEVTKLCIPDPNKSRLLNNRIPIGLPIYPVLVGEQCKGDADPVADLDPNPCFRRDTSGSAYYEGWSSRTTASTVEKGTRPTTEVRFTNPSVWFSLGLSHMTGFPAGAPPPDAGANSDAQPPPPSLPTREMSILLRLGSGFAQLKVPSINSVALPGRLVQGPDGFVYLVDMGDLTGTTGSSGQVLRISRSSATLDSFSIR